MELAGPFAFEYGMNRPWGPNGAPGARILAMGPWEALPGFRIWDATAYHSNSRMIILMAWTLVPMSVGPSLCEREHASREVLLLHQVV